MSIINYWSCAARPSLVTHRATTIQLQIVFVLKTRPIILEGAQPVILPNLYLTKTRPLPLLSCITSRSPLCTDVSLLSLKYKVGEAARQVCMHNAIYWAAFSLSFHRISIYVYEHYSLGSPGNNYMQLI